MDLDRACVLEAATAALQALRIGTSSASEEVLHRRWVHRGPRLRHRSLRPSAGAVAEADVLPPVRVLSYNILAPGLADPAYFPWLPTGLLDWDVRGRLVVDEIVRHGPDLVCLQECNRKLFNRSLLGELQKHGFDGAPGPYKGECGYGLLWRRDRFTMVKAPAKCRVSDPDAVRDCSAMALLFSHVHQQFVVLASLHLDGRPDRSRMRTEQVRSVLAQASALRAEAMGMLAAGWSLEGFLEGQTRAAREREAQQRATADARAHARRERRQQRARRRTAEADSASSPSESPRSGSSTATLPEDVDTVPDGATSATMSAYTGAGGERVAFAAAAAASVSVGDGSDDAAAATAAATAAVGCAGASEPARDACVPLADRLRRVFGTADSAAVASAAQSNTAHSDFPSETPPPPPPPPPPLTPLAALTAVPLARAAHGPGLVLCADLNDSAHSAVYAELADSAAAAALRLHSAYARVCGQEPAASYLGSVPPGPCIDFVWVGGGLRARAALTIEPAGGRWTRLPCGRQPSDHVPLVVEVAWDDADGE